MASGVPIASSLRRMASSAADSITVRSLAPLPCRT
jgi:hypothetical protein